MKRASLIAIATACALSLHAVNADEVVGLTTFTPGTPAKAAEVNGNFTAVKTAVDDNDARIDALQPLVTGYGDGSAGELVISGNVSWTGTAAPANLNYTNITIESGSTLRLPHGTTLRCSGTFTNNGTVLVYPAARGGFVPPRSASHPGLTYPHPGDTSGAASLATFDVGGASTVTRGPGGVGMSRSYVMSNLSSLHFGGGGGGGAVDSEGGTGGGVLRVLCNGAVQNNGTIGADGEPGSGGGGGGIVVLASRSSINNTGTITARGGQGDSSASYRGAGGGGGGGIVVLIAPEVANTGSAIVTGGSGGAATTAVSSTSWRGGGGGGGGSGGHGGSGATVTGTTSAAGQPGGDGFVVTLQNDPLFFVR